MYKKVVIFVLLVFMIFLVSCDDKSTEPNYSDNEIIVADETVVISSDDAEIITEVSENQLIFSQDTDEEIYQVDNIIASAPTELAPYGLLRKVDSYSSQNGQIVVNTSPARLEDALEQFEINITQDLKTSDIQRSRTLVDGVTLKKDEKNPFSFPYEIDFDTNIGDNVSLEINGDLSLTLGYEFNAKRSWSEGLYYVKAGSFITSTGDLELVVNGDFNYTNSIELEEYYFVPTTIFVGIVPVVMIPKVIIVLDINANGEASISSYVTATASLSAGLIYDKPDWSNYQERNIDYDYSSPQLTANMDVNVSAGPRFEVNLYGIAGPFVYGGANMNLTADINENPWWTLSGGYNVDVGIKFDALGYVLDHTFEDVISHSTILAQAEQNQVGPVSFTPPAGAYNESQSISLSCSTPGANIHYTTDNSNPTASSQLYDNSINLTETTTIKAIAYKDGWTPSQVVSADYTISQTESVANPTFSPSPGLYSQSQTVEINCSTPNAQIYYTLDGSEPNETSQGYTNPITIATTTTIKARAYKNNLQPSEITTAGYTINDDIDPLEMVLVPGGTFTMGDTRGEGYSNELPTHQVTLSSFYIGKYEVTQAEYHAVMGSNPSYFSGSDKPVERVTWYNAVEYCNARSIQEGLTPCYNTSTWACDFSANGYRLLTEAEWEYAARGGTNDPDYLYSGSNDINSVAWYSSNSTHNVGTKDPNSLGIYDMSGNVWEWCNDWYGSYSSSAQTDPVGSNSGSNRVLRGGSWYNNAYYCRVALRYFFYPSDSGSHIGFRVTRAAE